MPLFDWWRVWRLPTPDHVNEISSLLVAHAEKSANDFMNIPGEKLGPEFQSAEFNIPHIPTVATFL